VGGPLLYGLYFRTYGLKGDEKVLDFGCGGGAGSRSLLKILNKGGHLTCVDLSRYWIDKAKKRLAGYDNVVCLGGDIRKLNLSDSTFDVVSITHVIHDIAPVEGKNIIRIISQKLTKQGVVYIREPVRKSHGIAIEELRALFGSTGLSEINCKTTKSEYMGVFRKGVSSSLELLK
jgi:ubiquinone/menaquinone biosynthesis C-methylase UbiE